MSNIDLKDLLGHDGEFNHQYELSDIKYCLRSQNLIPFIKDNNLYIYEVNSRNSEFINIMNHIDKEYYGTYEDLISVDDYFETLDNLDDSDAYLDISKHNFFGKIISKRTPTSEDIYKYYRLYDEERRRKFINDNYSQEKVIILEADVVDGNVLDSELQAAISKAKRNKLVATIRILPKLYSILYLTCFKNDFYLEFIAEELCQFVYGKKERYTKGQNVFSTSLYDVDNKSYTEAETNLDKDKKIELLREIYNTLKFDCIYQKELSNLDADNTIFKFGNKEITGPDILEIARNNSDIIYNSLFTEIYNQLNDEKNKVKELK